MVNRWAGVLRWLRSCVNMLVYALPLFLPFFFLLVWFALVLMHQGRMWDDMPVYVRNLGKIKPLFLTSNYCYQWEQQLFKICFRAAKKWTFMGEREKERESSYFSLLFARWTQMQAVGGWQLDTCLINLKHGKKVNNSLYKKALLG